MALGIGDVAMSYGLVEVVRLQANVRMPPYREASLALGLQAGGNAAPRTIICGTMQGIPGGTPRPKGGL